LRCASRGNEWKHVYDFRIRIAGAGILVANTLRLAAAVQEEQMHFTVKIPLIESVPV
jgi:hypothetical protein